MRGIEISLGSLEEKVDGLLEEFVLLKKENEHLKILLKDKCKDIEDITQKLEEMKRENSLLKISRVLVGESSTGERIFKAKVKKLLCEVQYCITELKKK